MHATRPPPFNQVTHNRQRGLIVFLRVYAGTLHAKETLQNSTRDARERPLQLLEVRADDLTPVDRVGAGHTVAAVGLKETYTGDTLVAFKVRRKRGREGHLLAGRNERRGVDLSHHQPHTHPSREQGPLHGATLDGVSVPAPVFALAVEPVSSSKQQALEEALAVMQREDPSLRVDADAESGQLLLRGVGELHLDIVCDRLRRVHNVAVETGRAYVAYREGVTHAEPTVSETVYDRQVCGRRLFAGLRLRLEPRGGGQHAAAASPEVSLEEAAEAVSAESFAWRSLYCDGMDTRVSLSLSSSVRVGPYNGFHPNSIHPAHSTIPNPNPAPPSPTNQALNAEERASLLNGLADACQRGPLAGYPVAGFDVRVEHVRRDNDTTPGALRACSVAALAQAMRAAGAVLLEPVMRVEVLAPEASFGQVLSDLTVARRGAVRDVDGRGAFLFSLRCLVYMCVLCGAWV